MLVFQGDLSSPRIFWAALTPLAHELNWFVCEYKSYGSKEKVKHLLLYMDDLKQISRSKEELKNFIKIQNNFKQRHKIIF
jgi:hypothetical protein